MNSADAKLRLEQYIRSRIPLVLVNSHEEDRVMGCISDVVDMMRAGKNAKSKQDFGLFSWSLTEGIQLVVPDPTIPDDEKLVEFSQKIKWDGDDAGTPMRPLENLKYFEDNEDIDSALSVIIRYVRNNRNIPTLFVLKDVHNVVDNSRVIRYLRDLASLLPKSMTSVIMLSPDFPVPADLDKQVMVIDWPLPDAEELREALALAEKSALETNLNGDDRDAIIRALQGLSFFEAINALKLASMQLKELNRGVVPLIIQHKKQIVNKTKILEFIEPDSGLDEVGGLEVLKQYSTRKMSTFSTAAREAHIMPAKGILILGVPGGGKSLIAKSLAFGKIPILRLDMGALFGKFVGESESNMRMVLKTAEAISPCILWVDEIEKGMSSGMSGESDGGTTERVKGTLLTWMQEKTAAVFVVATANRPWILPSELLRRFDNLFFVDLPHVDDRERIIEIHLNKRGLQGKDFDVSRIARETKGYTGAEIEKSIVDAVETAFVDGVKITDDLIVESVHGVVPIKKTMEDDITHLRDWGSSHAKPASVKTFADEINPVTENSKAPKMDGIDNMMQ